MEISWQHSAMRIVAFMGAMACMIVTAGALSAALATDRTSTFSAAGQVLIVCFMGTTLLVLTGLIFERELLRQKLMERSLRTLITILISVVFSIVLFTPLSHVSFVLGISAVCLFCASILPTPELQMRGIAVCDAALCFGFAECLRRAGSWDVGGISRYVLVWHAFGVTFPPGSLILMSVASMPILLHVISFIYAVAALHSASIVLMAMDWLLTDLLRTQQLYSRFGHCMEFEVRSLASSFLSSLSGLVGSQYIGAESLGSPCPAPVTTTKPPVRQAAGTGSVIFFGLVGLYICTLMIGFMFVCSTPTRVVPTEDIREVEHKPKRLLKRCYAVWTFFLSLIRASCHLCSLCGRCRYPHCSLDYRFAA